MKRPDFSGLWRLNLSKSRLPGLSVSKIAMEIKHNEPSFVQAVKTAYTDGRVSIGRIAGDTTGAEFTNPFHNLVMRGAASWIGDELVIDSLVDLDGGRQMHFRDCWSLSADGNEITMEHRDDDIAGQISILERVTEAGGA